MKMKFLAFSMLATAVVIVSCKGDKGELGPAGPNGKNSLTRTIAEAAGSNCATGGLKVETGIDANNNGTLEDSEVDATKTKYVCNGATGSTGATGTANVYYSDWIVVNDTKWVETNRQITPNVPYTDYNSWLSGSYAVDNYTDTSITYQAEVLTPKITQEILDKGVVFYYFKDMTAPSNGKIFPFQSWDGWSVGMTNRTTDWSNASYFYFENASENGDIQKDKMVFRTSYEGSAAYYDAALNRNGQPRYHYSNGNAGKRIKYSELKPKTNFAIRYVVIPGGITGKYAGVDFKNYEQVKKLLNIKD